MGRTRKGYPASVHAALMRTIHIAWLGVLVTSAGARILSAVLAVVTFERIVVSVIRKRVL